MFSKTAFLVLLVASIAYACFIPSEAAEEECQCHAEPEPEPEPEHVTVHKKNFLSGILSKIKVFEHTVKEKLVEGEHTVVRFVSKLGKCASLEKHVLKGIGAMELQAASSCVKSLVDTATGLIVTVASVTSASGLQATALRLGECMAVKNYPLAKTILEGVAACMIAR